MKPVFFGWGSTCWGCSSSWRWAASSYGGSWISAAISAATPQTGRAGPSSTGLQVWRGGPFLPPPSCKSSSHGPAQVLSSSWRHTGPGIAQLLQLQSSIKLLQLRLPGLQYHWCQQINSSLLLFLFLHNCFATLKFVRIFKYWSNVPFTNDQYIYFHSREYVVYSVHSLLVKLQEFLSLILIWRFFLKHIPYSVYAAHIISACCR